ncbi:MAG: DUF4333 domain-containing protein [Aquihabitans sp.]
MTGPRRRLALAVLAIAFVVLSACSDDPGTLDQAATERAVGKAVGAQVDPKVGATSCEEPIEQQEGGRFTCEVTLEGAGDLSVTVTQVDDQGTLDVVPEASVVTRERIVSELRASLKDQFERSFQVACDDTPEVAVRKAGSTSTCIARDATSRRSVTVTVSDTAGTLAFAVGKATG